ncbi:retrovirus-related pol polyprotein from transposon TNT 1-94 [Tanacetum coccineum]
MIITDPTTFREAAGHLRWKEAMDAELASIKKNQTWSLVILPDGAKAIGYAQEYGIDYTEVFAPVARMNTVRMIIAMAAQRGWGIHQLDVKSAFLHGELNEDVFVEQPQGYEVAGKEHMVYKLHKALYGLKQAPRAWFSRIEAYFTQEGFESSISEQTLFIKRIRGKILIVSIYVDDLLFTGDDDELLYEFKQKYAAKVIERFGMQNFNSVCSPIVPGQKIGRDEAGVKVDSTLYKQMVGSLMYLTATRPDLMYVVCLISRFMANPTQLHFAVVKRIMRYLKGTMEYGIWYKNEGRTGVVGYTDSDYAGDIDDSKSTSGYVFLMGGGAVAWSSRKQPIVTLSTTEAEYIAAATCACQAIWMRRVLKEIGYDQGGEMVLLCDNTSTIKLSKNAVLHGRSKHIRVRYHFLRDLVKEGVIKLVYCHTEEQLADIMTKPLKMVTFQRIREAFGMCILN